MGVVGNDFRNLEQKSVSDNETGSVVSLADIAHSVHDFDFAKGVETDPYLPQVDLSALLNGSYGKSSISEIGDSDGDMEPAPINPNRPEQQTAREFRARQGDCPNGHCGGAKGAQAAAGDDRGPAPWDKLRFFEHPEQFFNLMAAARNRGVSWPPLRMLG